MVNIPLPPLDEAVEHTMKRLDRLMVVLWRYVWWPAFQLLAALNTIAVALVFDPHSPLRTLFFASILAAPGCWVIYRWCRWCYRKLRLRFA